MKRILVTGGAGYIGSVLTEKLLESEYEVTVLDALIYTDAGIKRLQNNPRLTLIRGDLRDLRSLKRGLSGVDCVIHLAAIANDPSGELDRAHTRKVNLDIYPALLSEAAQAGVTLFLNMSSVSVYGLNSDPNLTEDAPVNPLTEYGICKAASEEIVRQRNSDTFTTVSLRAGTVCGWSPRMRFDLCANTLTAYALANKKLTVWGGNQQRPQIHIRDLTDFLLALLTTNRAKIGGKIFNVAGHNASVGEIAETIREAMNGAVDLSYGPPRDDERSYNVSSKKISNELGLRAKRSIKEAVLEIIDAHARGWWNDPDDSIYHNVRRMVSMEQAVAC